MATMTLPPGPSILLNPSPPYQASSLPRTTTKNPYISASTSSSATTSSASSSNSSSQDDMLSHSLPVPLPSHHSPQTRRASSPARRIRFAPLPDPRRAVLITETGAELPLPSIVTDDDSTTDPRSPDSFSFPASFSTSAQLLPRSHSLSALVPSPTPSRNGSMTSIDMTRTTSSGRRNASPARSGSTMSSTPTLAKKLLKPLLSALCTPDSASVYSNPGVSTSGTNSVPASATSSTFPPSSYTTTAGGAPLSRISSGSSDRTARQMPMLNGRVYGRKRSAFANSLKTPRSSTDSAEPEFVEWGQAGMGAVGPTNSPWARLKQSGDDPLKAGRGVEDEDDGSGMAWLRKRRAQRAAAMKEEKEREGQGGGGGGGDGGGSASSASSMSGSGSEVDGEEEDGGRSSGLGGGESDGTEATVPDEGEEHEVKTVSVAARKDDEEDEEDDDSEEGSAEGGEGREEDDEEDLDGTDTVEDEAARKTARGAGVEVISRHHH